MLLENVPRDWTVDSWRLKTVLMLKLKPHLTRKLHRNVATRSFVYVNLRTLKSLILMGGFEPWNLRSKTTSIQTPNQFGIH